MLQIRAEETVCVWNHFLVVPFSQMFPIQFRHQDLDISDNDLQEAVLRVLSFSLWQLELLWGWRWTHCWRSCWQQGGTLQLNLRHLNLKRRTRPTSRIHFSKVGLRMYEDLQLGFFRPREDCRSWIFHTIVCGSMAQTATSERCYAESCRFSSTPRCLKGGWCSSGVAQIFRDTQQQWFHNALTL